MQPTYQLSLFLTSRRDVEGKHTSESVDTVTGGALQTPNHVKLTHIGIPSLRLNMSYEYYLVGKNINIPKSLGTHSNPLFQNKFVILKKKPRITKFIQENLFSEISIENYFEVSNGYGMIDG